MANIVPLNALAPGNVGRVKKLLAKGSERRRMLDLGLINDTTVKVLRRSPSGDPVAYEIRRAVYALRSEEACKILVECMGTGI